MLDIDHIGYLDAQIISNFAKTISGEIVHFHPVDLTISIIDSDKKTSLQLPMQEAVDLAIWILRHANR